MWVLGAGQRGHRRRVLWAGSRRRWGHWCVAWLCVYTCESGSETHVAAAVRVCTHVCVWGEVPCAQPTSAAIACNLVIPGHVTVSLRYAVQGGGEMLPFTAHGDNLVGPHSWSYASYAGKGPCGLGRQDPHGGYGGSGNTSLRGVQIARCGGGEWVLLFEVDSGAWMSVCERVCVCVREREKGWGGVGLRLLQTPHHTCAHTHIPYSLAHTHTQSHTCTLPPRVSHVCFEYHVP